MTPAEWLKKELAEIGEDMASASRFLGYASGWLSKKIADGKLDEFDALAIVVDMRRHVQGKPPLRRFEAQNKRKKSKTFSKIAKAKTKQRREEEYDPYLWY